MQGNGASPTGWTVISIIILHAHSHSGHTSSFQCSISGLTKNLSCIIYMDNTDLIHLCEQESDTIHHTHTTIQAGVSSWGNLLIATGGTLKPLKCSYYLVGHDWDTNGKWTYSDTHSLGELGIIVPLPDSSTAPIQQLSVHSASTTLGGSSCPTGATSGSLEHMVERASSWAQQARNSGLQPQDFHVSVARKFWPKVRYGLSSNTSL